MSPLGIITSDLFLSLIFHLKKSNPVNGVAIICDNLSEPVVNLVFSWLKIRLIGLLLFQNLLYYMQSFEHFYIYNNLT